MTSPEFRNPSPGIPATHPRIDTHMRIDRGNPSPRTGGPAAGGNDRVRPSESPERLNNGTGSPDSTRRPRSPGEGVGSGGGSGGVRSRGSVGNSGSSPMGIAGRIMESSSVGLTGKTGKDRSSMGVGIECRIMERAAKLGF